MPGIKKYRRQKAQLGRVRAPFSRFPSFVQRGIYRRPAKQFRELSFSCPLDINTYFFVAARPSSGKRDIKFQSSVLQSNPGLLLLKQ